MTVTNYYRYIRTLGPFRAIEALALAHKAAALDAAKPRISSGPTLVCWEDGEVRLSFSIKVF